MDYQHFFQDRNKRAWDAKLGNGQIVKWQDYFVKNKQLQPPRKILPPKKESHQ